MADSLVERFIDESPAEVPVRGFLHRGNGPSGDGLVLTHGAGSSCSSPFLVVLLSESFAASGLTVLRYDLPYRGLRPHGPPPRGSGERDRDGIRRAASLLRSRCSGRLFAGGHSYGGRQTTMLAAADPSLFDGLLLLSYPLHPPKKPSQARTAHFRQLNTPALFVQGSRDPFASLAEMEEAIALIPADARLLPVEGGAHSLSGGQNQEELPKAIVKEFLSFFGSRANRSTDEGAG